MNWKKQIKEYLLIIGIGLVWSVLNIRDWSDPENIVITALVSIGIWLLMWKGNQAVVLLIDPRISWVREPVKRFVAGIIAHSLYTVAAFWLFGWILDTFFGIYIGYEKSALFAVGITLVIAFFLHSVDFLNAWRESHIREEKLEKEAANARLQALKNQVNPHFLFNSFNTLNDLIHTDKGLATDFLQEMSAVFRYVLENTDNDLVEVERELKFLNSYIFLQKQRFGDNLHVEIQLDHPRKMIPPLSLYMVVENAIKHNVASIDHPLNIRIWDKDGYLYVRNNLKKKDIPGKDSSGLGLKNIADRYSHLGKDGFEVVAQDDYYTVKLPLT